MKRFFMGAALMLGLALPQAMAAQDRPKRSVEDYVCLLSGKCDSADRSVRQQAPPPSADAERADPTRADAPKAQNRFFLATPRIDLRLSFHSGSATLTPAGAAEARVFATALRHPALASKRFRIEGHTDSVGSRASNLRLSQRRADAVASQLARLGVARRRLEANGHGFDRPLPGLPASAPANRRVEAVALP